MNDLKFALRQLTKHPGFSFIAILTLALGIGSSSTVFTVIQGVLLTPPPYPHSERLILINPSRSDGQAYNRGWPASQWLECKTESKTFETFAGYGWNFNFLILPGGSESIEGMSVTHEYFNVLGIQPALGRAFHESDAQDSNADIIILGHDLWQKRFQGDPQILGKTVSISRRSKPLTIVGVMPRDVRFLPSPGVSAEPNYNVNSKVDYWVPVRPSLNRMKKPDWNIIGRLRPNATLEQAQSELESMTARQSIDEPDFAGLTPRLMPLEQHMNREGNRLLLPMAAAAVLVFLIACGNASGLLLARGLKRQHEYALRAALGARPFQLCSPILAESLLLSLGGGVLGVILATVSIEMLKSMAGAGIPRLDAVHLGLPTIVFCLMSSVAAGIISGLLPALRSLGGDPSLGLKAGSRTASSGRVERRWLGTIAAGQIALTLALLVGAGLLIQTVFTLVRVQPGYSTDNLLTLNVTHVGTNWLEFHSRSLEQISQLPGVKSAAYGWGMPLTGNKWFTDFEIVGESTPISEKTKRSWPTRSVTPDYFESLSLKLVEGRGFVPADNKGSPQVAIVNQAAVKRYFNDKSPLGHKLQSPGNPTNSWEIVGVLADARTDTLTDNAEPELYLSFWQHWAYSKHLVVRTHDQPKSVAASILKLLHSIDPTVSVENIQTLQEIRDNSIASRTFAMKLLAGFAVVACIMAVIGLYGVLSLTVGSRQTEIAIRMAIGAQRSDVAFLLLKDGMRLAGAGIGMGVIIALALAAALQSQLFGVTYTDTATLLVMVLILLILTFITSWVPARRASKIDPMCALRGD